MKLSREEVQRVAVLARLRLTPEEQSSLTEELDRILGYMDKLNQLDTADVDLFSHAANITNTLREDQVTNRPNADALLANAPDRDGIFFKVPKIIE
jgi:aspartyl-tRNA(Asn)/glutamyl-tRNA(Gln) amidotransferase subunit C